MHIDDLPNWKQTIRPPLNCGCIAVASEPAASTESPRINPAPLPLTCAMHSAIADLLAVAQKCEAMLARQKWLPHGPDPESVLLRETRAAIAKAKEVRTFQN